MNNLDNEIENFKSCFCAYGSLDIATAIQKALDVGLTGEDLYDILEEQANSLSKNINQLDSVYEIYEHILQQARNKIDEITGFDFINDGAEITTHGNYMATSYDFEDEYIETLKEKIKGYEEELKQDIFTNNFLETLGIF